MSWMVNDGRISDSDSKDCRRISDSERSLDVSPGRAALCPVPPAVCHTRAMLGPSHRERERETLRRFSPWSLCRSHPLSLMFLQGGRLSVPYHRDASDVSVTIELSPRTNYTGGPLQRHPSPFSRCFNSDGEGVSAQTTPAVRYKTTQTVNGHCRQGKARQAKPSQGKARQ